MSEIIALDLNGLGDGTHRRTEAWLIDRQRKAGITVIAAHINWRSHETALQLRNRIGKQAQELLISMGKLDKLVLSSRSAGVHLALIIAQMLDDPRVRTIGHSGRIRAGDLSKWDPRTMERCAHLGTDEESRSFYDGVHYCEKKVISNMTQAQKDRTLLTTPFAGIDPIVPGATMPIEGVRNIVLPAVGHSGPIGLGMYLMPSLVDQF